MWAGSRVWFTAATRVAAATATVLWNPKTWVASSTRPAYSPTSRPATIAYACWRRSPAACFDQSDEELTKRPLSPYVQLAEVALF
jgi:hypothetical protein